MAFKQINTQDQNMQLIQNNVNDALLPLQRFSLIGSQLLVSLALVTGQDNLITHNLGYTPTLVLPFAPNVDTRIWSPTTTALNGTSASPTQINLRCSANCIVSVMVK